MLYPFLTCTTVSTHSGEVHHHSEQDFHFLSFPIILDCSIQSDSICFGILIYFKSGVKLSKK
ncbi:hypothetical protein LEP1GSC108_4442 [Leptospira weilii str. UI 13098]|uniref:Uncharacterized protein n=1 Tax=Leptospira weilii str. UI 13098 TaxID=1088542 RepID=M6QKD0_9LEPT|nr:hypothetical protein LEP1GSC108_4442 [Leptospira weilii str. UI 13098]